MMEGKKKKKKKRRRGRGKTMEERKEGCTREGEEPLKEDGDEESPKEYEIDDEERPPKEMKTTREGRRGIRQTTNDKRRIPHITHGHPTSGGVERVP